LSFIFTYSFARYLTSQLNAKKNIAMNSAASTAIYTHGLNPTASVFGQFEVDIEIDEEEDDDDDDEEGEGAQNDTSSTGRWTREEHHLFLRGLELHGKGWKKIASLIKTRTVVQIRTHAQKYFLKLQKARQGITITYYSAVSKKYCES